MKFSFDFPEPSVVFGDHRFGFLVFTDENTYALSRPRMVARGNGDALELTCDEFTWAGGQEKAPGKLTARFRRDGTTIEWDVTVEMQRPIKTVTTVIRDMPRGMVSLGGGQPTDTRDGDVLGGYTFGAGDLHNFGVTSMTTPVAIVQAGEQDFRYITTLDDRVRPEALLLPGRRASVSRGGDLRARRLAQGHARAGSTLAAGSSDVVRGRDAAAHGARRKGVPSRAMGRAPRRPELVPTSRARHDAARHALHGVHLQRLCAPARDSEVDGDADSRRSRARVSVRMGRPLLLGLSQLRGAGTHGRRGRASSG